MSPADLRRNGYTLYQEGTFVRPVFRKWTGEGWGNIPTAFEAACRAAKIDAFRFHDLGHTARAGW